MMQTSLGETINYFFAGFFFTFFDFYCYAKRSWSVSSWRRRERTCPQLGIFLYLATTRPIQWMYHLKSHPEDITAHKLKLLCYCNNTITTANNKQTTSTPADDLQFLWNFFTPASVCLSVCLYACLPACLFVRLFDFSSVLNRLSRPN